MLIGGPGAHQSPILAFVLLPFVYIVARFLIWLWPRSAKWLFATVLAGGIVYATDTLLRVERVQEAYRSQMMLTEAERKLLNTQPFGLSVVVDASGHPPIYQENLVRELKTRKWFSKVGKPGEIEHPDLIARICGSYYGDKQGHAFTLERANDPGRRESIDAWHWVAMPKKQELQTLYEERLEMEVARAVQTLKAIKEPPVEVIGATSSGY